MDQWILSRRSHYKYGNYFVGLDPKNKFKEWDLLTFNIIYQGFKLDTKIYFYNIYCSTYERAFIKKGFEDIQILDMKIPESLTDDEKTHFTDFVEGTTCKYFSVRKLFSEVSRLFEIMFKSIYT